MLEQVSDQLVQRKVLSELTIFCSLEDEVHVQIGQGTSTAETQRVRREFLMEWIKQVSVVIFLSQARIY